MDLVTLALAKSYTDKEIQKAEMGDIQLDTGLGKSGYAADSAAVKQYVDEATSKIPNWILLHEQSGRKVQIADYSKNPIDIEKGQSITSNYGNSMSVLASFFAQCYQICSGGLDLNYEIFAKRLAEEGQILVDNNVFIGTSHKVSVSWNENPNCYKNITIDQATYQGKRAWMISDLDRDGVLGARTIFILSDGSILSNDLLSTDTTLTERGIPADAKIVGDKIKIVESNIETNINQALTKAKESGEFDGADGVSVTHEWNGTVLKVTSAAGTSSADLKGEPGKDGGKGADGQPGKDGTSPVISVSAITGGHRITITDVNGMKTVDVMDGSDYSFDPTVYGQVCINGENYGYGLPVLYLTGDTTGMSKDTKVSLNYVYGDLAGTCTLKWQGNTSAQIAQAIGERGKFNYTIVFDNAFEAHPGWGEQKKYCLKANWNDPSHARNIVSAKLWGLMAQSRADVPQQMAVLPNAGAVDGFPIVIMLNGAFHGLYTFNIPKDEWMFGLGGGTQEAFISADNPADDTHFKGETALDADGMELEWATDENNVGWVKDSLNRMINACVNSWGGDLDTVVGKYLDWASAIDHLILIVLTRGGDNLGKNYLMVTYDGVKWYFAPYDMDLTYGTQFYWQGMMRPVSEVTFDSCAERIRVFELIKRFKTNAFKERYWALRKNALSESRIVQYFENFGLKIPLPVMIEDVKLYPSIPGSSVCNIDQIARWVRQRLETMDGWVNALPAQETPVEPEEPSDGYTNLVPLSIDITGSVFNGTGFKENVRLNSSGAESTSGAGGCIVSGFIPYSGGVIRAKGCTVDLSQSGHYVACYDADFNCLKSATSSSIANYAKYGSFEQQEDGKCLLTVSNLALFLSENFSVDIANVKYIRVSMPSCNGADFIVTIGEPIV